MNDHFDRHGCHSIISSSSSSSFVIGSVIFMMIVYVPLFVYMKAVTAASFSGHIAKP